ncbi:Glutathione S-transferase I [Pleurostoma richardsiae]|uniref:Glutathione S-transferase I n=1 Tax=Pleurostoma richardsiae TaxID=41990 RepID=A0AA38RMG8_9PEZI|nr:Glutathione S-transferase I [Pleurostoma richardsiae]
MANDAPKIKLHWLDGSRAQSVLWLLEELQVPYELELYHRASNLLAPPELEKVHPLGKSPVVTITPPGEGAGQQPIVLAESGFIIQYLCEHFAKADTLVPRRWREGREEGGVGAETEEWMRYQYIMYYSEGSFMPYLWLSLVLSALKGPSVPFFLRPITGAVAGKVHDALILPNWKRHLAFLEQQLKTSPGGGKYLAGARLTACDIIMSYPLIAGRDTLAGAVGGADKHPEFFAYIDRLQEEPGWKKGAAKIKEIEGYFSVAPKH